jgi:hypothetical protein
MKRMILLFIMHPFVMMAGISASKAGEYKPFEPEDSQNIPNNVPSNASKLLPLIKIMVDLYQDNDKQPSSHDENIYYADEQGFYSRLPGSDIPARFQDVNRITLDKVQIDPSKSHATVECNLRIGRGSAAKTTHEPAQPAIVPFGRKIVSGCTPEAAAHRLYLNIAAEIITATK